MKRGFENLPCLACGEPASTVVHLDNGLVTCNECECEIGLEEILERLGRWAQVAKWLSTMPAVADDQPDVLQKPSA